MRFEHWFYIIPLRLRSLLDRSRVDRELEEELQGHIEQQTDYNISRGMNPEEARRAALIAMGGTEKQRQKCREERRVHWIDDLARDLTFALRTMRRNPGFTVTVLLTLSLSIGANTAVFSADHALLFRTLPYRDPNQLVDVFQAEISDPEANRMPVAPANFLDWKAENKLFNGFAAWQTTSLNLSAGDNAERVRAGKVSGNLFSVLGVEPMLGRAFRSQDDMPGAGSVVILSYELWKRRYAESHDIVGKNIRANDQTYTVVGVMPEGFRFPIGWVSSDLEAWTPLALTDSERSSRKDITLLVIARLRPGVTVVQAQSGLAAVAQHLGQVYPDVDKRWTVNISRMSDAGISDFRGLFIYCRQRWAWCY
jgi:MacB-like periplasmic core domain